VPDSDAELLRELLRGLDRFPSLFALSFDAVALYDRAGKIVVGNDASRALIGAELAGSHFSRHMFIGERAGAEAQFKLALSGALAEFETQFTSVGGATINVLARLVPALVGATIVGVFGVARDITQQRRAEAARDESRQQFQSLFEQHPDSISMIDATGHYTRFNSAYGRLTGYHTEDLVGKMVGNIVPPSESEDLNRYALGVIATGKAARYQRVFRRKDGSQGIGAGTAVPIVVNGKLTGMFLMSRDITDRARMHDALALQARRTDRSIAWRPKSARTPTSRRATRSRSG
jgi:two-component system sporulation sensor kinase A